MKLTLVFFFSLALSAVAQTNPPTELRSVSTMTQMQLSRRLVTFFDFFSSSVQAAGDRILESTNDTRIRRQVIRWKLRSIGECQDAVFLPDPLSGYIDALTLCVQMDQFVGANENVEWFGDRREVVIDAIGKLRTEIENIGRSFLPAKRFKDVLADVERFAAAHQIRDLARLANRPQIEKVRAYDALNWLVNLPLSPYRAVRGVDQGAAAIRSFTQVAAQFSKAVEFLPQQMAWEMELTALNLHDSPGARGMQSDLESFSKSAGVMAEEFRALPAKLRLETSRLLAETETRTTNLTHLLLQLNESVRQADQLSANLQGVGHNWAEAGRSLNELIGSYHRMMLEVHPDPKPGDTNAPSPGIVEYGVAAGKISAAAAELRALISELNSVRQVTDDVVDRTTVATRGLIWTVTAAVCATGFFFFALLLAFRAISARSASARGRD